MAKDALHWGRGSSHTIHRIDKWAQTFRLIIVNDGVADVCLLRIMQRHWLGNQATAVDFVGLGT